MRDDISESQEKNGLLKHWNCCGSELHKDMGDTIVMSCIYRTNGGYDAEGVTEKSQVGLHVIFILSQSNKLNFVLDRFYER